MKQEQLYDLLGELDAGIFLQKITKVLADVALGVVTTNKPGKVVLTFDMKQIGTSNQVHIKHKIDTIKPTQNGKDRSENSTETPVYVGVGGALTVFPEKQEPLFKGASNQTKE